MFDFYGKMRITDLKVSNQKMNETIDLSLPIENYFKYIDECIHYVDDGKNPITAAQVIQKAHHTVLASGIYIDDWKVWRKSTLTNKHGLGSRMFLRTNTTTSNSRRSWVQVRRYITAQTLWSQTIGCNCRSETQV